MSCNGKILVHDCPNCYNNNPMSTNTERPVCPQCFNLISLASSHCSQITVQIANEQYTYCVLSIECDHCNARLAFRPYGEDSCRGKIHPYVDWRIFGRVNTVCTNPKNAIVDRIWFDPQKACSFC